MKNPFLFLFILSSFSLIAQRPNLTVPAYTPATERIKSMEIRENISSNSLVKNVPFRSVGPTVFSGRITDLDVSPNDPSHFYVAYASGGLWKTKSNGMDFTPLFEQELVMTIGDIAVDWKNDVIWVGTGEVNSSRSSYSGVGMYKSSDGGKTWEHKGLGESHHIGRVIIHPTDPNTLWVAALGHLYSPNQERGIFKTTDGGATWKRTLFVDQYSGAIDLSIDTDNPNVLYAATWHRERYAWNFVESGKGSGIYKSIDGGENWTLISTEKSGFPTGKGVGRIGLDMTKHNGKTILYAVLDNYDRRPKEEKEEEEITKDELRVMTKTDFFKLDKTLVQDYLKRYNFPKKYDVKKVNEMIEQDNITPLTLVEYVETANSLLFDTPVIGAEVYRSDDQGKTWKKTHDGFLDNVFYSYGYYFAQVRVAPQNPDKVYIMGVPIIKSDDAGKTWKSINGDNVHSDHHALWINPKREGHLLLGNDGGLNISYDDGEHWIKANTPALGQFYYVAADMAEPYQIYGGLQDNGVWMGPSTYKASTRWHGSGQYPYQAIMGGDGMQIAIDSRDNATVYTGYQFGNYFRLNTKTETRKYITPKHDLGERPFRWNWQTPIHLSVHNQDILYMGSNKVHRSFNQGNDFEVISEDLTTGGKKGDVAFSTLTALHESSLKFGLIYVGSDDGLVHVTQDAGHTWTKISDALPKDMWVSRIQASVHDEATVYISLNGYRWDNFTPMVYKSKDYGQTWERISKGLPLEPINVVKEDPENANILYVGTDHGLYISLDQGATYQKFEKDLPAAPVHDVVIHPRDKDLIVGTHGRSIYVGSAKEIQQLTPAILDKDLTVFGLEPVKYRSRWGDNSNPWREVREPEVMIPVFVKNADTATFKIKTTEDLVLYTWTTDLEKGLNYVDYKLYHTEKVAKDYAAFLNKDLKEEAEEIKVKAAKNELFYLKKGTYVVEVAMNGTVEKVDLVVE